MTGIEKQEPRILAYSSYPELRSLYRAYFDRVLPSLIVDTPVNPDEVIKLINPANSEDFEAYKGFLLEATIKEPIMLEIGREIVMRYKDNRRVRIISSDIKILDRAQKAGFKTINYPLRKIDCREFISDIE